MERQEEKTLRLVRAGKRVNTKDLIRTLETLEAAIHALRPLGITYSIVLTSLMAERNVIYSYLEARRRK